MILSAAKRINFFMLVFKLFTNIRKYVEFVYYKFFNWGSWQNQ